MSSIFESGVPLFVATDTTAVLLHYSTIEMVAEKTQKMFQSPVSNTGHRTWKTQGTAADRGRHLTFNVHMELHKFDSAPLTSPYNTAKSVASLLLTYENDDVEFYPFYNVSNPKAVKNNATTIVRCHFVDIQFGWKVSAGALLDTCELTFMTNDFCDIAKLLK